MGDQTQTSPSHCQNHPTTTSCFATCSKPSGRVQFTARPHFLEGTRVSAPRTPHLLFCTSHSASAQRHSGKLTAWRHVAICRSPAHRRKAFGQGASASWQSSVLFAECESSNPNMEDPMAQTRPDQSTPRTPLAPWSRAAPLMQSELGSVYRVTSRQRLPGEVPGAPK